MVAHTYDPLAAAGGCLSMCGPQRQHWVVMLVCGLLLLAGTATATAKTLPTEPIPEELGGAHPPRWVTSPRSGPAA